jgi:hypothetical protein
MAAMSNDELVELVRKAMAKFDALPPQVQAELRRKQRTSFVLAEAGFGSDKDEADYRAAVLANDAKRVAELESKARQRVARAKEAIEKMGI